jgi:hypothetical protein
MMKVDGKADKKRPKTDKRGGGGRKEGRTGALNTFGGPES